MPSAYRLRPATPDDVFFLADAIRAADSAETPVVPLQRIFDLSNLQIRHLLLDLAETELVGTEYSYANFWLYVDADDRPVAGLAAWVEAAEGLGSNVLKAQQLAFMLGRERWQAALPRLGTLAVVDIPREDGAVQLDSIYLRPEVRGQGLLRQLVYDVLRQIQSQYPEARKAQIQLLDHNTRALHAYAKCGFVEARRISTPDAAVRDLLPAQGRVLLERLLV